MENVEGVWFHDRSDRRNKGNLITPAREKVTAKELSAEGPGHAGEVSRAHTS